MNQSVIIGTRGSDLALWQAHFLTNELANVGATAELNIIKTQGDIIQHLSFDKMEGKGFFTKEIEAALLSNSVDIAVHSHKDLETTNPEGLTVAAVSYRENPRELLLIRKESVDTTQKFELKQNAIVGTSSARRKSQLLGFRSDVELKDLRGNVPTRIQKLRDGNYDAIMLAAAGVYRLELDLSDLHVVELNPTEFIPAPAQGVLAFQCRENDTKTIEILQKIHHQEVQNCIQVERSILKLFNGGCQLPLGAYCIFEDGVYKVWAAKSNSWSETPTRVYLESSTNVGLAEQVIESIEQKKNLFS